MINPPYYSKKKSKITGSHKSLTEKYMSDWLKRFGEMYDEKIIGDNKL